MSQNNDTNNKQCMLRGSMKNGSESVVRVSVAGAVSGVGGDESSNANRDDRGDRNVSSAVRGNASSDLRSEKVEYPNKPSVPSLVSRWRKAVSLVEDAWQGVASAPLMLFFSQRQLAIKAVSQRRRGAGIRRGN